MQCNLVAALGTHKADEDIYGPKIVRPNTIGVKLRKFSGLPAILCTMIVPEGAYPHVHKHTDSLCTVKGGCACVEEAYTSLACHLTVTCFALQLFIPALPYTLVQP